MRTGIAARGKYNRRPSGGSTTRKQSNQATGHQSGDLDGATKKDGNDLGSGSGCVPPNISSTAACMLLLNILSPEQSFFDQIGLTTARVRSIIPCGGNASMEICRTLCFFLHDRWMAKKGIGNASLITRIGGRFRGGTPRHWHSIIAKHRFKIMASAMSVTWNSSKRGVGLSCANCCRNDGIASPRGVASVCRQRLRLMDG